MDLSALIFVALAVAWAVYLVPKALKQHEEDADSRSVEGFSDRLRVLARRDAVSATEAALVPAGGKPVAPVAPVEADEPAEDVLPESADDVTATPTPAPRSRSKAAARRAAQRRRRVFNVLVLAILATIALATAGVVAWPWLAAPLALMALWLVACRLMVKRERAARSAVAPARRRRRTLADEAIEAEEADDLDDERDNTEEIPVVTAALLEEPVAEDPDAWTPVAVPLPTYVDKAPAGRTVRTIDLDSTGVWSSGRNEADSQLAREADAQRAKADPDAEQGRRATGS